MNKSVLKSYRYGHHSKAKLNQLKGDKIQYNSINKFLEIENSTFNFIKPLALLFFTLNAGVMAALFNAHPQHKVLIIIFASGIFISLIFLLFTISCFRKSIDSINISEDKFIELRKKAHWHLQISIYFCLLTFEVALLVWGGETFVYIIVKALNSLYSK